MKNRACLLLSVVLVLSAQFSGLAGAVTAGPAVDNAMANLSSQQLADGSYVDFDGSINATLGVVLADAAAGRDPRLIRNGGASAIEYLASQSALLGDPATASTNTAKIAELILALSSIGEDPYAFGGVDWIALLNSTYDPATGKYGSFFIHHPWAILALKSAGVTIPADAAAFLLASQEASGAFSFNGKGTGADTNATALCLQALTAIGETPSSLTIQNALAYLRTQQNDDGGFPWDKTSPWGTDSDASSTSWVIQGLVVAGEDPFGAGWARSGGTPMDFLTGMQNPSGAFGLMKSWSSDNFMATYQAVPALLGRPFPFYADFGGGDGGNPATQPAPATPGTSTDTGDTTVQSPSKSGKGKTTALAGAAVTAGQTSTNGTIAKLSSTSSDASKSKNTTGGSLGASGTLKKILYTFFGFLGGSVAFLAVITVKRRFGET